MERQTAAMRELSRRAFPEPEVIPDDAPAAVGMNSLRAARLMDDAADAWTPVIGSAQA
ncbi:hypothetical protein [Streptomyces sp. NPDC003036]|uniref:hypothetical protein n=1 Tax=Streptomyces sp. NPDC003036 TaxID=3154442 RepID=UPI0033A8E1EA